MASWHLAPSLAKLRDEVDERWPRRSKVSDGTIGDAAHSARTSQHNPNDDPRDSIPNGAVTAIDITSTNTALRDAVLKAAIGNARVWYVINRGKIWSRTYDWRERDYDGSNPHTNHIHISLEQNGKAYADTSSWGIAKVEPVKPAAAPEKSVDGAVSRPKTAAKTPPTLRRGSKGELVATLQRFLGVRPDSGKFGPLTAAAVRRYQREQGLVADGVVGPKTWGKITKSLKIPGYNA